MKKILSIIFMVFAVTACGKPKSEMLSAPITGLNHTATAIPEFYVDGNWGGNIAAMGGGGGTTCCLSVPSIYPKAGLKVKVRWNATDTLVDHWYELDVKVDPYPVGAGSVYVHFLADGSVRVIASNKHPMHPDYPGPGMPKQRV